MGGRQALDFPRRVREPIILIGAGRSGTTLLGELLALHPDVAYWGEPRPIWMHGNAYRRDHLLRAEHLTPRIARYIDRRFGDFLDVSGRTRFLEKTPSNCLRIEFIRTLYPDARFLNLIRDGRAVVRSMLEIRRRATKGAFFTDRLRATPLTDWPAYVPMFFRTVWRTNILGRPGHYWGTEPPGWRDWLSLPPHLSSARQWEALVTCSRCDGRELPADRYLELRFEDLLRDPARILERIQEFTGIARSEAFFASALAKIDRRMVQQWSATLTPEQEREVEQELEPLLRELGYLELGETECRGGRSNVG